MEPNELTLEQQFKLRQLTDEVKHLSLEKTQELIIEISRQSMCKENLYKFFKWRKNEEESAIG